MNLKATAPTNCQQCPHLHASLMGTCQISELSLISVGKMYQVYQKGQTIFRRDSRAAGLYCIREGKVKISRFTGDGKEQIIRMAKEGDVLGYRSLMTSDQYATTAVALSDCVVCMVPRADFFSIIEQNAQFSHSLMRLMAKALGEAEARIMHNAYKPVRERLAEALLLLHRLYEPGTPGLFSIPITREDLAALMGTAKETASRLLSAFREEGLIKTQGSRITLLDLDKLGKLSALYD